MKKKERLNFILKQIKDIKIQGANNVAKAGINAFLLDPSRETMQKIISLRSTEPLLSNSLIEIEHSKNKKQQAKKLIEYIEDSKEKIAKHGAKLIKNDMNVFSHCHSSSVIEILKYAKKKQKKNFVVYTLEVEPLLQGRQTAKDLAEAGIKVIVFPDLAAEEAMKKCDIFLFGVDAFTKKGVANKIGTSILCKIAKRNKIKTYTCGVSKKFTKKLKIEYRNGREVWDERNKNIIVINPAFDFTKKKYISGVISELGILSFKDFLKKVKK